MKIYTKGGDQGQTSLLEGKRVSKTNPRLDAYGTIDELNSVLGLALAENLDFPGGELFLSSLASVQSYLFTIGSHLACEDETMAGQLPALKDDKIAELEKTIDGCSEKMPPLKSFILPGGSRLASLLHQARTVCRRAERAIVTAHEMKPVDLHIIRYINRLSDFLFVMARYANFCLGVPDQIWKA